MVIKGKADYVIENVVGCGPFQVVLFVVAISLAKMAIAFTILFMSFGNYNPGWICLDNVTSTSSKGLNDSVIDLEYTEGSCDDFEQCQNVEFNPETSTVVTEWGLLCDKDWIPRTIISVQMIGMLIGSIIGGQLSDLFGRKKVVYVCCVMCAVLQLISSFSVSWTMMIGVRFVLGLFAACVLMTLYINISEFMTVKWRAVLMAIPIWYVGGTLLALVAMGFKNWRYVERTGCAIYTILLVPVFWVPESLRWLEVKGKSKEFNTVVKKMSKLTGKSVPTFEELDDYDCCQDMHDGKKYSIIDLFRVGYRFQTISVLFLNFIFGLIYYALSFGVKSLYGDFYLNLIIANIIAIPVKLCAMTSLRYGSRIFTTLLFIGISIACSFAAVGCLLSDSEGAKATGSTVLVFVAKGTMDAAWTILYARVTEMYPTVIRSTSLGFASLSARAGSILAPFMIPNEKGYLYIFITVSAIVLMFTGFLSYKLPETKGVILKETFDDDRKKELKMIRTKDQTKLEEARL